MKIELLIDIKSSLMKSNDNFLIKLLKYMTDEIKPYYNKRNNLIKKERGIPVRLRVVVQLELVG